MDKYESFFFVKKYFSFIISAIYDRAKQNILVDDELNIDNFYQIIENSLKVIEENLKTEPRILWNVIALEHEEKFEKEYVKNLKNEKGEESDRTKE